ncbi:unnamed protein product [Phytomonas sp. Hart1]|nr:unnamed protein product [Phytomonas sp. Hart1]|eukprot:CCW66582.1 unnamed protein product [Phytomonas sp. isolate Hart1]
MTGVDRMLRDGHAQVIRALGGVWGAKMKRREGLLRTCLELPRCDIFYGGLPPPWGLARGGHGVGKRHQMARQSSPGRRRTPDVDDGFGGPGR